MNTNKSTSISYSEVGMLSQLTRDYLDHKKETNAFYEFESNAKNIKKAISNKKGFPQNHRDVLVNVLNNQYGDLSSKPVQKNINLLLDSNTFTITTGHQLNLFTGPLYFIYKIISAIKTADFLNKEYPDNKFVPVYWMATEDHDFDEINHAYLDGNKMQWNSDQTGMVGEFSLEGIGEVVNHFCSSLGESISAKEMSNMIRSAYLGHENLADATRYLVHQLFNPYGLVVIDGNNRELKRLFTPIVKKELDAQLSFKSVTKTIDDFGGYKVQVSPREINLFYAQKGLRERIIKNENGFEVNNTEIFFDQTAIYKEINDFPERFSPNVILRPVYQEVILPNLVYIGGGAELAYWLELKSTFEAFQVPYPLVQIRSSFLALSDKSYKKLEDLNWSIKDVFRPKSELIGNYTEKVNPFIDPMTDLVNRIQMEVHDFGRELEEFDPELLNSLKASQKGIANSLNRLGKKVSSSVKRKNSEHFQKIDSLLNEVNPNGVYQERQVNFFELYAKQGKSFLDSVFDETEPFSREFKVMNV